MLVLASYGHNLLKKALFVEIIFRLNFSLPKLLLFCNISEYRFISMGHCYKRKIHLKLSGLKVIIQNIPNRKKATSQKLICEKNEAKSFRYQRSHELNITDYSSLWSLKKESKASFIWKHTRNPDGLRCQTPPFLGVLRGGSEGPTFSSILIGLTWFKK